MDFLLTVIGLAVIASWGVFWVLTSAALMVNEPKPARKAPPGLYPRLHRPIPRR